MVYVQENKRAKEDLNSQYTPLSNIKKYFQSDNQNIMQSTVLHNISSNSYNLWHARIEHILNIKLAHMIDIKSKQNDHYICEIHPFAKQ